MTEEFTKTDQVIIYNENRTQSTHIKSWEKIQSEKLQELSYRKQIAHQLHKH